LLKNQNLKMMILAAMFAAVTAVCAQITLNVPPVPFTLQTIAVALTAMILGSRFGALAMVVYVLVGSVGVPVFAGFSGGAHIIVGKTGGYLLSYIPAAFVIGWIMEKGTPTLARAIGANLLGLIIIYALGVSQLKLVLNVSWPQAFSWGALPFLVPDCIKLVISSALGVIIRKRLIHAGLLTPTASYSKR
jgi:biotin transport system substrate-specific component